jgi:flagellar basal-body rod protein FlgF
MDGIYASVTRQMGLVKELDVVAQNIANAGTTGYRSEGLTFSEYIKRAGGGAPSLSLGHARAFQTNFSQGALEQTGGPLDVAIEGDGFFQVGGPDGPLLTRAGSFTLDPAGSLVATDGAQVLDAGGAPIQIPPGDTVVIARDGTISRGGVPIAQIGLVQPENLQELTRVEGSRFSANGPVQPVLAPNIVQGALESSNTQAILEIARMIEVQNAYSLGQSVLEREDERIRAMLRVMEQR